MIVACSHGCGARFDDEFRLTYCPHETFAANDGKNNFSYHPEAFLEEKIMKMPNWLGPVLKTLVYPGLAVMAQRLIVHWGILQTIPYVKHLPTYILMGVLLILKNPLEAWIKDQGA